MIKQWRAKWVPAALTSRDVQIIGILFLSQAAVRGTDYLRGPLDSEIYLSLTRAYPTWLVGACLVAGAILGMFGMARRCHTAVWLTHGWLAIGYGLIGLSMLVSIIATEPLNDPLRTLSAMLFTSSIHLLLAMRTGPRPLAGHESHPVETITEANEGGTP